MKDNLPIIRAFIEGVLTTLTITLVVAVVYLVQERNEIGYTDIQREQMQKLIAEKMKLPVRDIK